MTDVSRLKRNVQVEEVAYKAAVSESTWNKIGGAINFINDRQYDTRKVCLDGSYWVAAVPLTGVESLEAFPFDAEVFNVCMYNMVSGSGGTTELDFKVCTSSGGSFTSIFAITPKIASTAGNNNYFLMRDEDGNANTAGTGQTMPTFAPAMIDGTTGHLNIDAGSALRCDLIAKQTGFPENCGIILYFRAR